MTDARDRSYLAAADLLRVLSVALVAWFHIWQQSWLDPNFTLFGLTVNLQRLVRRGYMMVDLMLLLSGFLLYWPEARRARRGLPFSEPGDFFRRRAARILPSYWFCLVVCAALSLLSGPLPGSVALWKDMLYHLVFAQTFSAPTYLWTNLNVVLWTLAVEVQFYLLFPLVGRLFRRSPAFTWAGLTVLALLSRYFVWRLEDPTLLLNQLPCMLDLYAFGMLAAHALAGSDRKPRWYTVAGSVSALLGIGWVLWMQGGADGHELQRMQLVWRLPLAVFGALFLYCGGHWGPGLSKVIGNRALRFFAGISYNFYIWHQYLAVKLKEWHIPAYTAETLPQMTEGRSWQQRYTLCCVLAALAAAILTTYLVEKPFARLWDKKRRTA